MKKHIIFDMDGVIIDSEPEYQKRIKIFMERNGFTITDELSFQICGSNRKDTYELFQENVPDFVMSYEAYNKGCDQVNAEYPLNLRAIVNEDIYPLMEETQSQWISHWNGFVRSEGKDFAESWGIGTDRLF